MAIFATKKEDERTKQIAVAAGKPATTKVLFDLKPMRIFPRLSEKTSRLAPMNKYVFKVDVSATKITVRQALEKVYGVKIADINMIRMQGKVRQYRNNKAKLSNFKKAVVTLKPDSKKFDVIENV